jgi:regulator of protease activity HflC (stomatin/prohibitin superfamily)
MNNSRVMLFGVLIALVLFCSLCLFTGSPYEHALVECFGAQVTPIQLLGEPPGWIVEESSTQRWAPGVVIPHSVYESERDAAEAAGKALPYKTRRAPLGSGLFLKLPPPFNRVHKFSNRLNVFNDKLKEMQTRSNEPIMVQPYVLWQVQNPLQLWKSAGGDEGRIDEKLESRLTSVLQGLVAERYGVEDFYSLDALKLKELQEAQRRRLLAVVASPDVERKIEIDTADYRRRRLLRATPERFRELSDTSVGAHLLLNLPELPELTYLYWSFLNERQSRPGIVVNEAGVEIKGKDLADLERKALERQLLVPVDALKRDRGLTEADIERVKAFARRIAVQDMFIDEVTALWGRVLPALREMQQTEREPLKNWAAAWDGNRIRNFRTIFEDAVRKLSAYLTENEPWRVPAAELEAAKTVGVRTLHGFVLSGLRRTQMMTAAPRNREEEARARDIKAVTEFDREAVRQFADALCRSMNFPAPTAESVNSDALFRLLVDSEADFLDLRQRVEEARSKVADGSAGVRAGNLPEVPELITGRVEREQRVLGMVSDGLTEDQKGRIHKSARTWADFRFRIEIDVRKEQSRLQDVRGYPRRTVEEMKNQIQALEQDLAQSSLYSQNTVKISLIESQVRELLNRELIPQYGIVVREVGIRRLSFPPNVSSTVYARMKAERERIQRAIIATGKMEAKAIETQARSRRDMTIAEADAEKVRILGEGQAAAVSIMAEVVDNFELFKLMQDLQALESILGKPNTTLVLQAGKDALLMRLFGRGAPYELGPDGNIVDTVRQGQVRPETKRPAGEVKRD